MIKVQNLAFSYTKKEYMTNINFDVKDGEIFGFLGPSGAGKSTLQKILTGVLSNYSGNVIVNDQEVKNANMDFYENIGVDFEFPSLYAKMSGLDNLKFFASLYKKAKDPESLLEKVGLQFDASKKVSEYSKGMKSRLNFVKALIHDPKTLFLDEPTSGLDPTNAKVMKEIILKEKAKGKTIILTTHNMHDATELCDRVAFIVDGEIKVIDTPKNLIMSRGAAMINYTYQDSNVDKRASIKLSETYNDIELQNAIKENRLLSIHSSEPNLNDIFIEITGKTLQ
ncbi:ATP-binding protein [Candidatus Izimaplasma bacterium ZiA1]|uniref:ABC transporter ATP-binding protein n=1 Tax=Candidatus Izimoplasma sp. ZiA1 TaxID=2024899 RepID=UPI000BAA90B8|nr:ATP-binding protein [Candidatus Izimaplasma bacterium ZiA1]